ncbi:hypothetical protein BKA56DRAFT_585578 [Ilyonectria sp. MPI-CAGE-AT-0026]|nr:hypothetical protein BKA56DRAFT_585578 [Ilyonectria sp. MPI-CAGE-AT-0026]
MAFQAQAAAKDYSPEGCTWAAPCFTVIKCYERRQDMRDSGDKVLNWERPQQRLLDNGTRVLSSGEVIHC